MIDIEDHTVLIDYLENRHLLDGLPRPYCTNLHGGISNRTVLISFADGSGWVAKQALKKLRVAADWFSDPRRIHIEARGLRWLSRLIGTDAVPAFLFEDRAQHLLIMSAIPEPHENYKHLLMTRPPTIRHAEQFAMMLANLHINSYTRRDKLAVEFADTTFFENLRLDPYYSYSCRNLPESAPFLFSLIEGTRKRRLTLVHGDYSPKNILIHGERLILLDHEVIHFGDPAFDIGFSVAHLLSKAHFRRSLRRQFCVIALRYWQTYQQRCNGQPWASDLEQWCIHHTIGCLLARVAGKSVLEYLSDSQKTAQRMVVDQLIVRSPDSMDELIVTFTDQLHHYE